MTPQNPSYPRHTALAAVFTINLQGTLLGADIKLSASGIDTRRGLLDVPVQPGHRAFDAFYYLSSSSASQAEREFLDLKHPSEYYLLNRSGTFSPPTYLPDADDAAAADDWRNNLKAIGIRGQKLSNLVSCLAGLLKLGDTLNYFADEQYFTSVYDECGTLLDVAPDVLKQQFSDKEREVVIAGLYEALVDYVVAHANATITEDIHSARASFPSDGSDVGPGTPPSEDEAGDIVNITVVEIPSHELGKAVALRTVFDDNDGINAEMKEDGVQVPLAGSSVLDGMRQAAQACEADLGVDGPALRQQHIDWEKREELLEMIALEITDPDNFIKNVLNPVPGQGIVLGKHNRLDVPTVVASSRVWFHLSLHPCEASPEKIAQDANTVWSAAVVSRQLRDWRLPEWANRRNRSLDFTADFDHHEFFERYHTLGCMDGQDGIQNWIIERGWSNGEVVVGHQRVWVREGTWWEAESQLDLKAQEMSGATMLGNMVGAGGLESGYSATAPGMGSDFFPPLPEMTPQNSQTQLLQHRQSSLTMGARSAAAARSIAPTTAPTTQPRPGDYGLGGKGDEDKGVTYYDTESGGNMVITEVPLSTTRRVWVAFVWAVTWWIPSPLLKWVGRLKRPDVRMAWREKVVLVLLIFLLNATIVFYIIAFGKLLCPAKDKVWNRKEVSQHQGADDYYVSHHGSVYDLTSFYKRDHSDTNTHTSSENMLPLAGLDMDPYIRPPLYIACHKLVTSSLVQISPNTTMDDYHQEAEHLSGNRTVESDALSQNSWYKDQFLPKIKEFRKGDLVYDVDTIKDEGENLNHFWFRLGDRIYDLNYYFAEQKTNLGNKQYQFLDPKIDEMVQSYAGSDLTDRFNRLDADTRKLNLDCLENAFFIGKTDFRKSARCRVNDYILLAVTIILCTVIVVKFLAALQLGSKRRPANQDKFVICQVPAYTEGEDHIRKGLDSLTALAYDNKRKLICVICDGMIVGGGNDRPTPKIVLDILGVDPKVDPPALPFKSVGQGSEQLNYGKVYSGLYEFEGNVVPYIVVVKMGKESEQTKAKPGNRGKRDSQILLMSFLNRVHHRTAMNPLELEMFHQINNIIGVDPELYEYLFMVDADTMVRPDSLNRLVAACANDSKIAGICGETSLENEERSWWTMIQVYEYYISHHLAKAFESLFGSVTCLPGW